MLPPFRLVRPTRLQDALDVLSEDSTPYCGGTELLLAMRAGLHRPDALVDVKRLEELSGVVLDGDQLVVGARETHMDLSVHPLVTEHLPMFAQVEHKVGNARVRAQGSIAGNLCFAEPKSDVGTALIAHGASVTLVAAGGRRREVTVQDFILGPYYADKEPEELVLDVRVPVPAPGTRAVYLKFQVMERPTLGVALVEDRDAGRTRLVVGAVGEAPMVWDVAAPGDIDPAAVAAEVDPTPDLTGSERYKRNVTAVYVRRAVEALAKVGA